LDINVTRRSPFVLITGASSGIGQALCRECVGRGWKVIGIARSREKLSSLKNELGTEHFYPVVCDISNKQEVQSASEELRCAGLIPNLFFLNAGLAGEACVEDSPSFDLEKHQEIMTTNYFGAMYWISCWQKVCQENGGASFVATSSILAHFAPPGASAYSASKAALAKAFESLARKSLGTNLHFSVVYPGPVATQALVGAWRFTWSPEKMASYMIRCALQKKSRAESHLFYSLVVRLLNLLPLAWSISLLKALWSRKKKP
jgi:3-hydroxy acid dehydrogenase / malonic semialdehyde reductase